MSGTHRAIARLMAHLIVVVLTGCSSVVGLNTAIEKNKFVPVTPPDTKHEVGTLATIDQSGALIGQAIPSLRKIVVPTRLGKGPDLKAEGEEKFSLSAGISVPATLQGQLKQNGASKYSVVAKGVKSVTLPAFDAAVESLPALIGSYADNTAAIVTALEENRTFMMLELWTVDELEYTFYNKKDVAIDIGGKIAAGVDANTGISWSTTASGSLSYKPASDGSSLCVGYRRVGISKSENGLQLGDVRIPQYKPGEPVVVANGGAGSVVIPGGYRVKVHVENHSGYGLYFQGQLDTKVNAGQLRRSDPASRFVDAAVTGPDNPNPQKRIGEFDFETPGNSSERFEFEVQTFQRDHGDGTFTRGTLRIGAARGLTGVNLDTGGDSSTMWITWTKKP